MDAPLGPAVAMVGLANLVDQRLINDLRAFAKRSPAVVVRLRQQEVTRRQRRGLLLVHRVLHLQLADLAPSVLYFLY